MKYITHTTPIVYGEMSCIGTIGTFPMRRGNYFGLIINGEHVRVANMWAENLERANVEFDLRGEVRIRHYDSGHCLIIDDRIPPSWRNDALCFTGSTCPALDIITDMYGFLGDPHNEIEQYIKPEAYWTKRGYEYRGGLLIKTVEAESRIIEGARFVPLPPVTLVINYPKGADSKDKLADTWPFLQSSVLTKS